MATAKFIKFFHDHDNSAAPLTGESLYAVEANQSYHTTYPLTEDGTKDGLYYHLTLPVGVWDVYRGVTLYEQDIVHVAGALMISDAELAAGAVTSTKLADDAVTTNKLLNAAVTGAKIAANTVGIGNLTSTAVDDSVIVNGGIGASSLADGSVTEAKIADNSITAAKLQANSVGVSEIAPDAVTTSELFDSAVTTAKIANSAVTLAKLANDSVDATKITDGAITTAMLQGNIVTQAKLATNSVGQTQIIDNAISSAKMQGDAVTTAKILDAAVTGDKLAAKAVTASKINTGAVGSAALADGSVGESKIASNAVTTAKIATDSITTAKIADLQITAGKMALDAITALSLADDAVTSPAVADAQISLNHLTSALIDYIDSSSGGPGSITNFPDDVTIDENGSSQLQIKDLGVSLAKLSNAVANELQSRPTVYVAAVDSSAGHKLQASANVCTGTNDQNVINPLITNNVNLVLLPGNYVVSEATPTLPTDAGCIHVESKSNFSITVSKGAILKKANTADGYAIKLFECTRAIVVAAEIDGNKANGALGGGIQLANCSMVTVKDSYVHDCAIHGIQLASGTDYYIHGNRCEEFDNAHIFDINADDVDSPTINVERFVLANNYAYVGSSGNFDCIKVEDCQYGEIYGNVCVAVAGASNLVIGADVSDVAGTPGFVNVHHNLFIGGDNSLLELRKGDVIVSSNIFDGAKIQVGSGGGGSLWFTDNYVKQRDVNSALVVFASEADGDTIYVDRNTFIGPDTGTESKTISLEHDGVSTDYKVYVRNNNVLNFRNTAIEVDADHTLQPIITGNLFRSAGSDNGFTGNLRGIRCLSPVGAWIHGNQFVDCKQSIILNASSGANVQGNNMYGYASATAGILEENGASGNIIDNNRFADIPQASRIILAGSSATVPGNNNQGYLTKARGTITVNSGETTKDITPGLGYTLVSGDEKKVWFQWAENPQSATYTFPSFVDGTTLRCNLDDPGATITINWFIQN